MRGKRKPTFTYGQYVKPKIRRKNCGHWHLAIDDTRVGKKIRFKVCSECKTVFSSFTELVDDHLDELLDEEYDMEDVVKAWTEVDIPETEPEYTELFNARLKVVQDMLDEEWATGRALGKYRRRQRELEEAKSRESADALNIASAEVCLDSDVEGQVD